MAVRKARAIGVLRVPPRHRQVRVLLGCERRERGPRVPDVPPRKGHSRTCGPPEVRPAAPSRRATARGGVAARRHQRRVLHAARARERAGSLRERPRGRQSGAPARRSRTRPPARSRPHRERHAAPASELRTAACPPERGADRRRNDRNSRLRAERSVRHPVRKRPRKCPFLGCLARPRSGRRTSPASRSWTRVQGPYGSIGRRPLGTRWPFCAPRQAAIRTTAPCPTSSASCPRGARSSASDGLPTMSSSIAPHQAVPPSPGG